MKKNVLVIFHDSNPLSGATASMLEVVRRLNNIEEYGVSVLIPDSKLGLHKELSTAGIQYIEARIYGVRHDCSKGNFLIKKLKSFLAIVLNLWIAIKLAIGKGKFDLIYTNTSDIYIGSFLSRFSRAKHIWHVREFGFEDQNMSHCFGQRAFYKYLNWTSDKVIAISEALKAKLVAYGVSEAKIEMIHNDVTSKAADSPKVFNRDNPLSLLIVGSIIEGKGHKFVIDCVAHLKSKGNMVKLGIVGKDTNEYSQYLKKYTKELVCEELVEFLGYSTDVPNIRNQYDIAVVSSKSEAFGRVTVEAMQAKMTVLASDCGANPELIENGLNGFLFGYDNIQGFSSVVVSIDDNRDLLESIGNHAYQNASKFSSGRAAEKVNQLIWSTLNV